MKHKLVVQEDDVISDVSNGLLANPPTTKRNIFSITDLLVFLFTFIKAIQAAIYSAAKHIFRSPKSLKGKICLVTGAGGGLGRELCIQLAKQGAEVVCVDIREETNKETVKLIKDLGGKAHGYVCNIARHEEVQKLAATVQKEVGRVYMLINNAALIMVHKTGEWPPDDVVSMFNVNVISHYWTIQEFLPAMLDANEGHIVSIISIASKWIFPGSSVYGPNKAAAEYLLNSLRLELKALNKENNIVVSGVFPGGMETSEDIRKLCKALGRIVLHKVDKAAEIIIEGLRYDNFEIFVPKSYFFFNMILWLIPPSLKIKLLKALKLNVYIPTEKMKQTMMFNELKQKCL